jgi:type VI secretion system secreted protein VgrG
MENHVQRDWNQKYLLLSVEHVAQNQSYRGDTSAHDANYENTFRAMPYGVQYRPGLRTPRPIVRGTQTAIVIGPQGQEIYTDQYGRVQVRFFWADSDSSSCWVRVAQSWAGKNWGAIAIPRVGQEVVVDFLEGNPDRPLIIGSVYNADQMPPYELPANKTRSGVRSRSSEGGSVSNSNEMYLEDRLGEELFFIQAERDHQVKVKHDRSSEVGHDDRLRIGHNRTAQISLNDSLSIGSDRTSDVGKNDSLRVGAKLEVVAGQEIKLTAPGGSITIGPTGISIESPMTITVQGTLVKIN